MSLEPISHGQYEQLTLSVYVPAACDHEAATMDALVQVMDMFDVRFGGASPCFDKVTTNKPSWNKDRIAKWFMERYGYAGSITYTEISTDE